MERQMSVDERIRRAEERYNKKNGTSVRIENRESADRGINEENNTSKKSRRRKLLMQIFVCLVIYVVFYAIFNWDYIFSESFKSDVNTFFTEKTKLYQIYSDAKSYIENLWNGSEEGSTENQNSEGESEEGQNANEENSEGESKEGQNTDEENSEGESNDGEEQSEENQTTETDENSREDAVGGSDEEVTESEDTDSDTAQMEKDAEEIKATISFINPIEGTITSTFGWRNPTVSTVPKYHTGLDIAAVTGTVIKSATDGTVILASSEGDYGNHYEIQIDDVVIIYAHCNTLYLNEGDTVTQGQEIAEVGSTGNSTGPHLHFEIRKDDRLVDPQLILDI